MLSMADGIIPDRRIQDEHPPLLLVSLIGFAGWQSTHTGTELIYGLSINEHRFYQ